MDGEDQQVWLASFASGRYLLDNMYQHLFALIPVSGIRPNQRAKAHSRVNATNGAWWPRVASLGGSQEDLPHAGHQLRRLQIAAMFDTL
jgi:hypothetical protein